MSDTATAMPTAKPAISPPSQQPVASTPVSQLLARGKSLLIRKPYIVTKGRHMEPNPEYNSSIEGSESHHNVGVGGIVHLTDDQYESFKNTGKFTPHEPGAENLRVNATA